MAVTRRGAIGGVAALAAASTVRATAGHDSMVTEPALTATLLASIARG